MSTKEQIEQTLADLTQAFNVGGRLRREKLIVIGAYALLVVLTLIWGLSDGGILSNPIGARVEARSLDEGAEHFLLLHNDSDETWTEVELVLNGEFVHRRGPVSPGTPIRVRVNEFRYRHYVPRARRYRGWESVGEEPLPRPFADASVQPESLLIRTDQGEHEESF